MKKSFSVKVIGINVSIRNYGASIGDKQLSYQLTEDNNANNKAMKVRKFMIDDSFLKPIRTSTDSIKNYLRENSSPWNSESRIIPVKNWSKVEYQLGKLKLNRDIEINKLISNYDKLVDQWKIRLGNAANEGEFPGINKIRDSFQYSMEVFPVSINNESFDNIIQEKVNETFLENIKNQQRDLLNRLIKITSHFVERMESDSTFKINTLNNMIEISGIVRDLNVTENESIICLSEKIETIAKKAIADIGIIRENDNIRKDFASNGKSIVSEIEENLNLIF